MKGDQASLPKEKLTVLKDGIIHLVRNSIDHGIEIPEVRKKLGKDVFGTLEIRLKEEESGALYLHVIDDGSGINLDKVVSKAIEFIEKNISEPPTIPEISTFVGLSQRQLERQFKKSIGCSVVQFALLARLQYSRVLLIATDLTVREIATASGFNTLSHFAYAFKNCFNRKPSAYRQAWPDTESAPSWPGTLSNYLETLDSKTRNTKRARNNDS